MSLAKSLIPSTLKVGRSTGWIGIDIGSAAIKIVQLERHRGRPRIARSLILPAPEGRSFDQRSITDDSIAEQIREALATHGGFVGRAAACVVSMSHCELRTLVSASGSEEEQRELISLELKNDAMNSEEPREFDFWDGAVGNQRDSRGMTQVHVLSMPRSLADSIGTSLLDARLSCQVLDTTPFCMLRALDLNDEPESSAAGYRIALDWGWSAATVSIFYEGLPVMARCLRGCGLSRFINALAARLQLTHRQTLTLLGNYGLSTEPGTASSSELHSVLLEEASPLLLDLTRELSETIDFAKSQFGDPLQTRLVLCGGAGTIPGLAEQLGRSLRRSVRGWSMPSVSPDTISTLPALSGAASLSALAWEL